MGSIGFGPIFVSLRVIITIAFFFVFGLSPAQAVVTSTLPEGIRSPMLKMGVIQGLEQRYTEDGKLVRLTDYKSIEFDAATLSQFSYEAQTLISSLNRFGVFGLGDSLNLGVLEISAKPQINYSAPVMAFGINKKWTMALAAPIIQYRNRVKLSQSFSNIEYYRQQFAGLSPELDEALDTDIGQAVQSTLVSKGYNPLVDKEETFLGDLQLVSIYELAKNGDTKSVVQTTLTLPTGPRYDSDDLLALNSFHKLSIENVFALAQEIGPYFTIVPFYSLNYLFSEDIFMRVPKNESDVIPDESSKEKVTRAGLFIQQFGAKAVAHISDEFETSFEYKQGFRGQDKISGAKSQRYELLEKNTESRWQRVAVNFSYSTVKSYFKKTSAIPMMVGLDIFDTIAGRNIERQQGQELSLTLFF